MRDAATEWGAMSRQLSVKTIYLAGDHHFLNFATGYRFFAFSPFVTQGISFPTVEHFLQAHKALFLDTSKMIDPDRGWSPKDAFDYILSARSPHMAKTRGNAMPIHVEEWDSARVGFMYLGMFNKFWQHTALRVELEATDPHELVEKRRDRFWGYPGANMAGRTLMRVREVLISGPE
jgi:ribA/ribD-fused uncharacterized protein